MVMWLGNWAGVFSCENTPEGCTETHKISFFPYKQVSGRNGDHEWLKLTNTFILCDLLWKVQKSHVANTEGSFNIMGIGLVKEGYMLHSSGVIVIRPIVLLLWYHNMILTYSQGSNDSYFSKKRNNMLLVATSQLFFFHRTTSLA